MDFRELREFISDLSKYLIVAIVAILLFVYVISFMQVIGPSMEHTLSEGDLVFVSKIHYKLFSIKQGDIVVFENNGVKTLIKRVIGIPGDKIEFKNSVLYINGKSYEETYLSKGMVTKNFSSCSLGSCIVPEDSYLVLGDNRINSQDSREIGYIKKDKIIGKVIFRFWPISKIRKF